MEDGNQNGLGETGYGDEEFRADEKPLQSDISKQLEEKYKKAEVELKNERSNWMQQKVVYASLYKIMQRAKLGETTEIDSDQLDALSERINQAETRLCSENAPSTRQRWKPSSEIEPETEKKLRFIIEKEIQGTCEEVLQYHDSLNSFRCSNHKVLEARATKLGEIVTEEKRKLEMCYRGIIDVQKNEKQLYSTCMKGLYQSSEILAKIVENFRIKLQPKLDDEKFSNLISRCDATVLKAESMIFKLQKQIYSPRSIAALTVIRDELVDVKRQKHQETMAIEQQLMDLKSVGDEFNAIVDEYNRLQLDIEKHEWALQKFRS